MITFVGGGIRGLEQITLEGLHALQCARKVLTFQVDRDFFRKHGIQSYESLAPLYRNGAKDEDNYEAIENHIRASEMQAQDVAVLLPGDPRLGVTLVQRMSRGPNVRVLSGISSWNSMVNSIGVDPLEKGSVVMDVNRMLLFDLKLMPEVDHYLYHICSVGTSATHFLAPARDNSISLLQSKLCQTWSEDHTVILIRAGAEADGTAVMKASPLRHLGDLLPEITFDSSLYIPGIRPSRYNADFLRKITSTT